MRTHDARRALGADCGECLGDARHFRQFISQLWGVGVTIVWSGAVSVAGYAIVNATIGLRVPEDAEREGLDTVSHGESAYT